MIQAKRTIRIATLLVCVLSALPLSAAGPASPAPVFAADAAPAENGAAEALPPVTLRIDERFIPTDVPPAIIEGRTLVPARAVFEALGGVVSWDDSGYPVQVVSVSCYDVIVNLTIGAAAALVNGAEAPLDVPAQIVSDRTLIPVRFVSESLGFKVRWDEVGRIVDIYSRDYDIPPVLSTLEGVDVAVSDTGTRVSLTFAGPAPEYLANPNPPEPRRFSVGFPHTDSVAPMSNLTWHREISVLRGVRAEQEGAQANGAGDAQAEAQGGSTLPQDGQTEAQAQAAPQDGQTGVQAQPAPQDTQAEPQDGQPAPQEASTLWFTFDLLEDVAPLLSKSPDGRTVYLDFPKPQVPFDPWADGKLSVVLDPGHGTETIGKRSPDSSILEYAFNRDMAARVKAHLERHGVETQLTVTNDTDMPLQERCEIANAYGADAFVSLHANAYGDGKNWTKQNGWEIYVYKKGSFSEQLANAVHSETIPASGLADRGVKDYNYYVIRNVNMPAVLIEHGFYTNQAEIELLKSPEFRERLAVMDAKGILRFLGVAWTEPATAPTL
ncbi:MAG: N-acetylmuramoyl-L-alanine amidase [Clostridiales Family XIII bacterium]|jgi:N-acetylmuramoyl-L-alanine amidase|nr:N-acetylmuramoyl-L-alanine amidase [Clostridiales Family XIII bacterium]